MAASTKRFLVVEDDPVFSRVLTRGLRARGFETSLATAGEAALASALASPPDFVVLDLRLGEQSALPTIRPLRDICPDARICLLTGFASVATAVEAIKLGAHAYLAKPAHVDDILACLGAPAGERARATLDEVEWRHIARALRESGGNLSKTARLLGMHRRTLQRKIEARGDGGDALLRKLRGGRQETAPLPPPGRSFRGRSPAEGLQAAVERALG